MGNMSTIGFLCGATSWGGLEINVLRLARWLAERHRSVVIYGTKDSPLAENAVQEGLPFHPLSRVGKYGGLLSGRRLDRMIAADGVSVLTVHTSKDLLVASLAKKLAGNRLKLVFVQHMQIGSDKRDFFHTLEYQSLDAWVTPLQILADGVKRLTRLDPPKIHVIPYGIELSRFTDHARGREEARKRLDLPINQTLVGVVGRFDPKKGQDVLIRAARLVHDRGHPIHLLFVGEETRDEHNGYLLSVKKLASDLGLDDFIHFRPFMEEIESAYAAMDIFVLPSHSETYGMVTIEAMASGLPVIVTNTGGSPGIVTDHRNGLLVPPEDPTELSEALCRLLDDPDFARKLAQQARTDSVATYSHDRQCERLEHLFESLVSASL